MNVYNKNINLYTYSEIQKTELEQEFEKLKLLCNDGVDFVHRDDVIELRNIIVEPEKIYLSFISLEATLFNTKKE